MWHIDKFKNQSLMVVSHVDEFNLIKIVFLFFVGK